MKTFLVLLIVIIIGIMGWFFMSGYQSAKTALDKSTITDTMVIVKDSIINAKGYDSIPLGFYQGMMPCKNCEGIQRTIMFSDNHFKMEELNWGKGTLSKKTEGNWEKVKGKFILYVNDKVVSKYRLVKDSLINVENNGTTIPDSMSKQNVLYKKNTPPEILSWKKRKSEGIDIIGNGSEPFWSIEIDNEKLILFKLAASEKPVIVPIEKPVITKDSTFYSIVTEAGAVLKISISSKFCSDGTRDHLYEYKMTVWYKGEMYKGCAAILNTAVED
ncbi:MAG: copper resistance protein NlpE N-terminal domain-containing protein [Chitinophagaceae bacterium]